VVFDCAARYGGTSLNEQLLHGPDLSCNLLGVLCRFRQNQVAIVADIECMFYQVKVRPQGRDYLRFLWWPGGDFTKLPEEYCMQVHLFGATSSPCCTNYCLKRTAKDNAENFSPEATRAVERAFYVDDFLHSVSTRTEAIRLIGEVRDLLLLGGFKLTKWLSNDKHALAVVPAEDKASAAAYIDLDGQKTEKVLGVSWNFGSDVFEFAVGVKNKPITRRGLLSVISSLFDPLGFVAPVVLKARILLQRLCKQHCGWDEEVSQDYANAWQEWLRDLPTLSAVSIERCFIPPDFKQPIRCALHHFADASTSGYAVVTYLRVADNDDKIYCSFVMGKTRLAPLKAVTVPRLELQAATLATRQDQFLRRELDIERGESTFWSDSTAVLLSINNTSKRLPTFVANRLSKIEAASRPGQWRYVPTNVNPADEGSRGSNAREFVSRSRWLKAPKFLWEEADSWPESPVDMPPLPTEYDEVKVKPVFVQSIDSTSPSERLMAYYSSWLKLRKAVAWFHRFAEFLRSRNRPHCCGSLTCDDLSGAETAILRFVQQQTFKQEIDVINRCADQKRSCKRDLKGMDLTRSLFKLNTVLVDGTVRVGGRLRNALVSFDQKHPIILPHSHHVTDLIIRHCHNELHHVGASHTWTALRQRFWVIKGGVAVRRVLGQCVLCCKRGAHVGQQVMAEVNALQLIDLRFRTSESTSSDPSWRSRAEAALSATAAFFPASPSEQFTSK